MIPAVAMEGEQDTLHSPSTKTVENPARTLAESNPPTEDRLPHG
jgi:hypothetical protein